MRKTAPTSIVLLPILFAACGGDGGSITDPLPTAAAFMGCQSVQTIAVGQTVNGSLTTSDCRAPDDSYVDFYELTLTSARSVTITLNSSAFDAYLVVLDRSETVLGLDDDGGGGKNARVVLNLQPGTYIVAANSFFIGDTGAYQLSVN